MSEFDRVAKATTVVGSLTLLSRISGLARDIVIGYVLGAQSAADAFFVAFRIPNLLRRLTAEGALSAGFVPVLSEVLTTRGRQAAVDASRVIVTFAVLFLILLTAAGLLFPTPLTRLFAPGSPRHRRSSPSPCSWFGSCSRVSSSSVSWPSPWDI